AHARLLEVVGAVGPGVGYDRVGDRPPGAIDLAEGLVDGIRLAQLADQDVDVVGHVQAGVGVELWPAVLHLDDVWSGAGLHRGSGLGLQLVTGDRLDRHGHPIGGTPFGSLAFELGVGRLDEAGPLEQPDGGALARLGDGGRGGRTRRAAGDDDL